MDRWIFSVQLHLPNTLEQNRLVGWFAHNSWSFQQVHRVSNNQGVLETRRITVLKTVPVKFDMSAVPTEFYEFTSPGSDTS